MKDEFLEDSEICMHFGEEYGKYSGAVVPPIFENTIFIYDKIKDFNTAMDNSLENYIYTRGLNPTIEILEKKLAALEHGEKCKCFSSGMSAMTSALSAFLKQGDHILFINNIYDGVIGYAKYISKFGVSYTQTFDGRIKEIEKEIKENTRVIYIESPGTHTFRMLDLKSIADLAKSRGIVTIIDNTWATPIFQKPLDFGIDISTHSCSKYIGGHSDVVGGALISSNKIVNRIFDEEFTLQGGCLGPFEAWLLIRGLRTLPIRMNKIQESAIKFANFLSVHKAVEKVNYPALPSDPGYEIGKKQLKGYSGVMSFEIKSNKYEDIEKLIDACKVFKTGVSWGGFESLIYCPNRKGNIEELKEYNIPLKLIRISIGLENVDSLIDDLDNALKLL
jgi:cystathionine beta-lyase